MPSVGQTIREWRRNPWLAASIVGTIALCVGANVAVFTLVRSVVLAPLPYPGAARLVAIGARPAMPSTDTISITPAAFFEWRSQPSIGSSVAAYYPDWNLTLVEPGEARRVVAGAVSSNLLQVLGLRLELGRAFAPDEEWTGTGHQVILSHAFWRERFGSRSDVIGSEILLGADGWPLGRQRSTPSGTRFTVVGVLGEGASLPDAPVHLLVPLRALGDDPSGLAIRVLKVIGRVGAGEPALARSVLSEHLAGVSLPGPLAGSTPWVAPLRDVIVGDTARFLGIVAGAVGLILLLGCANLATLILLRSAARTRETAVRIAIGARSRDLARLVFADALLLGILGGLGALAVARAILAVATPVLAADLPRVGGVTIDAAVVGIALVVAVSCVLVPGVVGLARFPRHAPYELLRDGHRAVSPTAAGGRLRAGLIVTQLVVGLALVAAAGLLVRSVNGLLRTDVGFDATGVSTLTLTLPRGLFARPAERIQYFQRAIEEVRRIPGVTVASATSAIPLRDVEQRVTVAVTDEQLASPDRRVPSGSSLVFSGYFDAMRMRLRAGRDFTTADARDSLAPRVAIVNEAFASAYLRGADALGARVAVGSGDNPLPYTIVGVVNNTRHRALRTGGEPHLYMNASQVIGSTMNVVIRSRAAMPVASRVRATVTALHPLVQPYDEITLAEVVARAMVRERVTATLLTALSALAVLLLAMGVFGLMSAVVSERSREMAIRLALGASPRHIARHVLSYAARIVAVAILVGLPIAWGSAHAIESLLYGVTPSSLTAYLWGVVAIAVAALLASVGPVRRAACMDPLAVMRAS